MNSETFLVDFLEQVYLSERPVSKVQAYRLRCHIGLLSDFLRRHATLADLTKQTVNGFLQHHQQLGKSAKTLKNYRGSLLALWRMAWENELIDTPIRGVRNVRVARTIPDAFSDSEMVRLLAACDDKRLHGLMPSVPKGEGVYLRALIHFLYDCALRMGDTLKVRRSYIRPDNTFVSLQHKTKQEILRVLRPETVESIDKLLSLTGSDLVFGFLDHYAINKLWRQLLVVAGLPVNGRNGPQKVRRTSVSHLESIAPGTGQYHLGHLTPGLAARHYIDPRVVKVNVPLPPAIGRATP